MAATARPPSASITTAIQIRTVFFICLSPSVDGMFTPIPPVLQIAAQFMDTDDRQRHDPCRPSQVPLDQPEPLLVWRGHGHARPKLVLLDLELRVSPRRGAILEEPDPAIAGRGLADDEDPE